jgi:F0F1-type ATP synthase assembly protein I
LWLGENSQNFSLRIRSQAVVFTPSSAWRPYTRPEGGNVDPSQRSELTQSVHRSSGSFELVLGAVLFSLIGFVVDRSTGTTPLFMVIFAAAGFLGAVVSTYFRYQRQMAEATAAREHRS